MVSARLEQDQRFAIDPALPLVSGFQFHARRGQGSLFHGAISDTEPDGWGRRVILRDQAKRRETTRLQNRQIAPDVLVVRRPRLVVNKESHDHQGQQSNAQRPG